MKRIVALLLGGVLLGGCASQEAIRAKDTYSLCEMIITHPSALNLGGHKEEVARRGESCSKYAGQINRTQADQARANEQAKQEAKIAPHRNKCSSYGFKEGTDGFASCIQRETMLTEANQKEQIKAERAANCQRDIALRLPVSTWCDGPVSRTTCVRGWMGTIQCETR